MKYLKPALAILAATAWISISEFIRNQFVFVTFWTGHYQRLGLVFPAEPVNGALWGLWSLLFAISMFILLRKFTLLQTALLSWFVGFVLMWLVIGNLGVLPIQLLPYAIPWSFAEAFIAAWLIRIISSPRHPVTSSHV